MNPTHVDALVARGAALASTGQLRKAIDSFQAALQEDPDSVNARYYTNTLILLVYYVLFSWLVWCTFQHSAIVITHRAVSI
jgi:tetratricopeptide (TPR) repeat protein